MKLLIILSIEEFANDVRKILSRQKVPIYSETSVHGFRMDKNQPDITNWFASNEQGAYSTLFFSIQDEGCVERVFEEVKNYNRQSDAGTQNPLHAYSLHVDGSV
ncbi:MAG: hypothetical protein WD315_00515 [Balneolaceae bacterium]